MIPLSQLRFEIYQLALIHLRCAMLIFYLSILVPEISTPVWFEETTLLFLGSGRSLSGLQRGLFLVFRVKAAFESSRALSRVLPAPWACKESFSILKACQSHGSETGKGLWGKHIPLLFILPLEPSLGKS